MSFPTGQGSSSPVFGAIGIIGCERDQPEHRSLPKSQTESGLPNQLPDSTCFHAPASRTVARRSCQNIHLGYDVYSPFLLKGVVRTDQDSYSGGGHADIYRGIYRGAPVALGRLRVYLMLTDPQKSEVKQACYHESLLWSQLHHDHVLQFLGISEDVFEHSFCMVSPWMVNGNINDYIASLREQDRLPPNRFAQFVDNWLHQTSLGLAYLHKNGVVHGNLRGTNILIDESGNVRLSDFGISLISEANMNEYIPSGGSSRWRAPELMDPESFGMETSQPTYASDVYSFGCTCLELYTGKSPFDGFTSDQVVFRVVQGKRPERVLHRAWGAIPDARWELITSCWAQNPQERPTSSQVAQILQSTLVPPDSPDQGQQNDTNKRNPSTHESSSLDVNPPSSGNPEKKRHSMGWGWRDLKWTITTLGDLVRSWSLWK